ncbi:hypothetical protein RPATATE_1101 [Rickettsia parkeri str. Tate's Hell]|nr:hypothetical protein RPATATE_1101 [Rickettsia parkeri str. Tate's Hell]
MPFPRKPESSTLKLFKSSIYLALPLDFCFRRNNIISLIQKEINMKNFIKYLFFTGLYIVVTIIVAYMVLAQTIPNDGQCHMMDRPFVIHYILAAIITALPTLILIYSKKKK